MRRRIIVSSILSFDIVEKIILPESQDILEEEHAGHWWPENLRRGRSSKIGPLVEIGDLNSVSIIVKFVDFDSYSSTIISIRIQVRSCSELNEVQPVDGNVARHSVGC